MRLTLVFGFTIMRVLYGLHNNTASTRVAILTLLQEFVGSYHYDWDPQGVSLVLIQTPILVVFQCRF